MAVIGLLECGHYARYDKEWRGNGLPDEVCFYCKESKYVLQEWKEQWHTDCQDCDFHRSHGYAKKYGVDAKERHMLRTGHRNVYLRWYSFAPLGARKAVASIAKQIEAQSSATALLPPF